MADSSGAKDKDHLARIRDNQRRSRARRREYLQELETKFRNCEQMGVEASAEIQAAARKVLEENKRLRELLRKKGVSDIEIDTFIPSEQQDSDYDDIPPSATLQSMLGLRKPCTGQKACSTGSLTSTSMTIAARSLQPNATRTDVYKLSPASSASQSVNMKPVPSPTTVTPPVISPLSSTPTVTAFNAQPIPQAYPYPVPVDDSWTYAPNQGYVVGPVNDVAQDMTSCIQAANIIRDMSGNVGANVELELGCNSYGDDCKVPNSIIFDVMDRYTARSVGS